MKKIMFISMLALAACSLVVATSTVYAAAGTIVGAASAGDKLTEIQGEGGNDPYINLETGNLSHGWINDKMGDYNDVSARLAYRVTLFNAGTIQITDGTKPTWSSEDFITTFDFETNGYISRESIEVALYDAKYSGGQFIGVSVTTVDLGGIYKDSDAVTFGNTFDYGVDYYQLPDLSDYGTSFTVEQDGGLHHPYLRDIKDLVESLDLVEIEFGFFSVGATQVTGTPDFDPETTEIDLYVHYSPVGGEGFLSHDSILDAFQEAWLLSEDYFGVVGRFAPKAGTDSPYKPSKNWVVFTGSHQYIANDDVLYSATVSSDGTLNDGSAVTSEQLAALFDGNTEGGGFQFGGGSTGTTWQAGVENKVNILIDMGRVLTVNTMSIHWEAAAAATYNVYVGTPSELTFKGEILNTSSYWTFASKVSYEYKGEQTNHTDALTINAAGRYILLELITPDHNYGYRIFEIEAHGGKATHSDAYYQAIDTLDTLECQDFSSSPTNAKEVRAVLTGIDEALTEADKSALSSLSLTNGEEGGNYPNYYQRLQYLIDRANYHSDTGNSALIDLDNNALVILLPLFLGTMLVGGAFAYGFRRHKHN